MELAESPLLLDAAFVVTRSWLATSVTAMAAGFLFYPANFPALAPFLQPVVRDGRMLTVGNLQGLEFIDTAAPDAASDGQDAYTNFHHVKLDLNQNNGKEWSWYGVTVDPIRYPLDPRLAESTNNNTLTVVEVRNIGGHKYLAFTDQYSHIFMLHRLDGEIAVPMAVFTQYTVRAWATASTCVRASARSVETESTCRTLSSTA